MKLSKTDDVVKSGSNLSRLERWIYGVIYLNYTYIYIVAHVFFVSGRSRAPQFFTFLEDAPCSNSNTCSSNTCSSTGFFTQPRYDL